MSQVNIISWPSWTSSLPSATENIYLQNCQLFSTSWLSPREKNASNGRNPVAASWANVPGEMYKNACSLKSYSLFRSFPDFSQLSIHRPLNLSCLFCSFMHVSCYTRYCYTPPHCMCLATQ